VDKERPLDAHRRDAGVLRGRRLLDRLLELARVARDRREGVGHRREQVGVGLRDRCEDAHEVVELLEEAGQVGARVRQVVHHRRQQPEQARRGGDRLVEVGAAAHERVAEAAQVVLRGRARRRVEHVEDVVDVDGDDRLPGRQRAAVGDRALRAAALQVDELQPERRARADDDAAVDRDGADALVEPEVELRPDAAAGQAHRPHVLHDADAEAARAHLVALDEVRAVGDLHVQRARRHERQAVVCVVGQEHGDDRHEDRDRADEHGVGHDRARVAAAALAHGPRR
jgi:hypothetical protein